MNVFGSNPSVLQECSVRVWPIKILTPAQNCSACRVMFDADRIRSVYAAWSASLLSNSPGLKQVDSDSDRGRRILACVSRIL